MMPGEPDEALAVHDFKKATVFSSGEQGAKLGTRESPRPANDRRRCESDCAS